MFALYLLIHPVGHDNKGGFGYYDAVVFNLVIWAVLLHIRGATRNFQVSSTPLGQKQN